MILPAFGVTVADVQALRSRGCTLMDTTCGSVLNVWKNVAALRRRTATRRSSTGRYATRKRRRPLRRRSNTGGGYYLVVRDERGGDVCDYIRGGGARGGSWRVSREAVRRGFDPDRDLAAHRPGQSDDDADVGVAARSARAEGGDDRSVRRRPNSRAHFQAFDTICSATQDRQDAVVELLADSRST